MSGLDQKRDEELLAEHLAGNPVAFEALVARYAQDLYSFFQRFVGNRAAADDLVQETFLQVHLAAGTFDPGRAFRPWLYTIAANKARDYMRARSRRAVRSLDRRAGDSDGPTSADLLAWGGESPADQFEAEQLRESVREMITRMPEPQRFILLLGYYHRLPYSEIAEILGVPVGTVKSRLHAAVTCFAKLWMARTKASRPE